MNYWVKKGVSGVGKPAAKLLKEKGFSEFGLKEIHIDIADCNIPSIEVAKSICAKRKRTEKIKRYDGKSPAAGQEYVIEY